MVEFNFSYHYKKTTYTKIVAVVVTNLFPYYYLIPSATRLSGGVSSVDDEIGALLSY